MSNEPIKKLDYFDDELAFTREIVAKRVELKKYFDERKFIEDYEFFEWAEEAKLNIRIKLFHEKKVDPKTGAISLETYWDVLIDDPVFESAFACTKDDFDDVTNVIYERLKLL
jgi:hypothetical protein